MIAFEGLNSFRLLSAAAMAQAMTTPLRGDELDMRSIRPRGKRMSHDAAFKEFKKAAMQGVPNNRRAKVKAARKQNVQRLIAAKYA